MGAKSIDDVLLSLPKEELLVVNRLRGIIVESLPGVLETISYGVPYYRGRRMICFIWPPSVRWGPKHEWNDKAERGTVLGFCQGHRMSNENGLLLSEGRKQVYCMYFKSMREIDEEVIRVLLYEADLIDKEF